MKERPNSVISSEYLVESSCIYTSGSHNCVLNGLFNKCVSYSCCIVSYGVGMVIFSDEFVRWLLWPVLGYLWERAEEK